MTLDSGPRRCRRTRPNLICARQSTQLPPLVLALQDRMPFVGELEPIVGVLLQYSLYLVRCHALYIPFEHLGESPNSLHLKL